MKQCWLCRAVCKPVASDRPLRWSRVSNLKQDEEHLVSPMCCRNCPDTNLQEHCECLVDDVSFYLIQAETRCTPLYHMALARHQVCSAVVRINNTRSRSVPNPFILAYKLRMSETKLMQILVRQIIISLEPTTLFKEIEVQADQCEISYMKHEVIM